MVSSLVREESWIMDGTYESTLNLRIPAAEAIVMTRCSRWASFWGVISRSMIYRKKPRPDAPPKQPIDLAYMRYIWRYPVETDAQVNTLIEKYGSDTPVIRLDSRKRMELLVSALQTRNTGL
jgi:hypothetical protein